MLLEENQRNVYRRLFSYAAPYKMWLALAMIASIGVGGSDAVVAYLVKPFIDDLLIAGNVELVRLVPFLVIALAAFKGASRYVQQYNVRSVGQAAIQDIRSQLYWHIIRQSMRFFSTNSSGSLMSKILNDVNVMQIAMSDVLVTILREVVTMVALIGYAFYADWRMALMAFAVIPAAAVPASALGKMIKKYSRRGQNAMGDVTSTVEQSISGIKVVKSFGAEEQQRNKFEKENTDFYTQIRKSFRYDAASSPVIELLTSLGVAAVLWYGVNRVLAEEITKGEMFSILAAIAMMYTPLKRLTRVNNIVQQALGAGERVFELFDEGNEIIDSENAVDMPRPRGEVVFEAVSFAYNDESVLRDFSVAARPGEVIALVGPSGAGKSTIISLLNRFYDPQEGRILIDGYDICEVTQKSLHDNLALVDQETFLFNDSIMNNIRFGCPQADESSVVKAAQSAYADDFIRQLPDGYETMIGDRGMRLSGGQRQRICIARAILRDAPILMLDEATSALDTESEAMVQQALGNLMQNRTTFVIAHRLSTVMHADLILVLDKGQVKEQGSHQQLLARDGLYKRLYDIQFQESADA